jgi:hypothetical protein
MEACSPPSTAGTGEVIGVELAWVMQRRHLPEKNSCRPISTAAVCFSSSCGVDGNQDLDPLPAHGVCVVRSCSFVWCLSEEGFFVEEVPAYEDKGLVVSNSLRCSVGVGVNSALQCEACCEQ